VLHFCAFIWQYATVLGLKTSFDLVIRDLQ